MLKWIVYFLGGCLRNILQIKVSQETPYQRDLLLRVEQLILDAWRQPYPTSIEVELKEKPSRLDLAYLVRHGLNVCCEYERQEGTGSRWAWILRCGKPRPAFWMEQGNFLLSETNESWLQGNAALRSAAVLRGYNHSRCEAASYWQEQDQLKKRLIQEERIKIFSEGDVCLATTSEEIIGEWGQAMHTERRLIFFSQKYFVCQIIVSSCLQKTGRKVRKLVQVSGRDCDVRIVDEMVVSEGIQTSIQWITDSLSQFSKKELEAMQQVSGGDR